MKPFRWIFVANVLAVLIYTVICNFFFEPEGGKWPIAHGFILAVHIVSMFMLSLTSVVVRQTGRGKVLFLSAFLVFASGWICSYLVFG
ncbi:MAG: hypothetical protein AAGI38_14820 [Bacteroidota bacterium]